MPEHPQLALLPLQHVKGKSRVQATLTKAGTVPAVPLPPKSRKKPACNGKARGGAGGVRGGGHPPAAAAAAVTSEAETGAAGAGDGSAAVAEGDEADTALMQLLGAQGVQVPPALRDAAKRIVSTTLERAAADRATLQQLATRLQAALDAVENPRLPQYLRHVADLRRKLAQANNALRHMELTATPEALAASSLCPHIQRYHELERQAAAKRRQEVARAARSETRFLPTLPEPPAMPASLSGGGTPTPKGTTPPQLPKSTPAASTAALPQLPPPQQQQGGGGGAFCPANTLSAFSATPPGGAAANNALVVAKEMLYKHGLERRPVDLVPFDTCPKCHVAMQYNQPSQVLVCPTPHCGHWKRFADMTSAALAFGDEVEFTKYTYRPVSHLDDTMKFAEGTEASVVPAENLERVMRALRRARVPPNRLSISLVRSVLSAQKGGVENTVQIFSRLTGIAPRRMTAFMKDQLRIMFNTQEEPFRRHCRARVNNLSFPYTLYKYCELLGYWEMLEALPLLRGVANLGVHDAIYSRVCQDLGWQFIPTVGTGAAGALIAATNAAACATASAVAQQRQAPAPAPAPAAVPTETTTAAAVPEP